MSNRPERNYLQRLGADAGGRQSRCRYYLELGGLPVAHPAHVRRVGEAEPAPRRPSRARSSNAAASFLGNNSAASAGAGRPGSSVGPFRLRSGPATGPERHRPAWDASGNRRAQGAQRGRERRSGLPPRNRGGPKRGQPLVYAASLPGGAAGRVLFEPEPLPRRRKSLREHRGAHGARRRALLRRGPQVCAEPIVLVPKRTGADRFKLRLRQGRHPTTALRRVPRRAAGQALAARARRVFARPPTCPRCLGITPGKVANGASDVPFGLASARLEQACAALAVRRAKGASRPAPSKVSGEQNAMPSSSKHPQPMDAWDLLFLILKPRPSTRIATESSTSRLSA